MAMTVAAPGLAHLDLRKWAHMLGLGYSPAEQLLAATVRECLRMTEGRSHDPSHGGGTATRR